MYVVLKYCFSYLVEKTVTNVYRNNTDIVTICGAGASKINKRLIDRYNVASDVLLNNLK